MYVCTYMYIAIILSIILSLFSNDSSSSDDGVRSSHTRAVDLDGDGQVDILSLTEHTMMEDEGGGCVCYTMAVYWMKPQREWPIVG